MGKAQDTQHAVTDRSSLHRYRTEIPNIIDDMDLSVYAFRLYVRLKRVAGDDGKCFYSTRELAEQCKISVGAVSNAKKELLSKELIRIENDGEWERDNITIVDLWPANFAYFAQEKEPASCSPHEQEAQPPVHVVNRSVHVVNRSVHVVNTKEEPYKEKPIKEEPKMEGAPVSPDNDIEFIDGKPATVKQTMYVAICEAMGWDYKTLMRRDQEDVAETVKTLAAAGYTVDDIRRFMVEIWFQGWQWEKHKQRPKLREIRQEIGKLRAGVSEPVPRASPAQATSNAANNRAAVANVFAKLRAQQGGSPHG